MQPTNAITACRVSGASDLITVVNLGDQAFTGVFPTTKSQEVARGPLELVWSPSSGLLQLAHVFDPGEMYGEDYGYRSGLNRSMVSHLTQKVGYLERLVRLDEGDVVLDIGSNDATTLKAYAEHGLTRVGVDPTAAKFHEYYPDGYILIPDFFSADAFHAAVKKRAKVVTSIAMFYDLEDPVAFAQQVFEVLDDDGIWHFEQSYMPSMLRTHSYDTICHEHVEYYSLAVVRRILDAAEFEIVDVTMNAVNGGSFAVTAKKRRSLVESPVVPVRDWLLEQEVRMGLDSPVPFRRFEEEAYKHRDDLRRLIQRLNEAGKSVFGYGASTKGNVLLQFCGFGVDDIRAIAEVNEDKFGRFTPGTAIPIVSEAEVRAQKPDYLLVLPWHFKNGIIEREQEYLASGGRMIFPFPEIEIV